MINLATLLKEIPITRGYSASQTTETTVADIIQAHDGLTSHFGVHYPNKESHLSQQKLFKLIELFVAGVAAQTATELVNVNKNTATDYFHR